MLFSFALMQKNSRRNRDVPKKYARICLLFLMVLMRSLRLVQGQPAYRQAGPIRAASRMLSGSGHPTATSQKVFWKYF
jgi:hypothetical protein